MVCSLQLPLLTLSLKVRRLVAALSNVTAIMSVSMWCMSSYYVLARVYVYEPFIHQGAVTTMYTVQVLPFVTAVKMWSKGQGVILMMVKGSTW